MTTGEATVVDLFSGVGGFSLGFSQEDFDVKLAIDNHEITLETYSQNFPDVTTSCMDLSNATREDLLTKVDFGVEDVDVVIGGPPCQGFSVMGNQNPKDERNLLLPKFGDHISSLAPSYFILENVEGLLSDPVTEHLDQFLETVASAGYEVVGPQILNAADYGVPQKRKRVFILGYREGCPKPAFPEKRESMTSAWDALKDLPTDVDDISLEEGVYYGDHGGVTEYVKEINSWEPQSSELQDGLTGLDPVNHSDRVRERFSKVEPGSHDQVSQFYRLKKNEPANTLRAGSSRERGTHTPARPIHPEEPRCITVREAARLQCFPDWFEFHPTKYHGLRQVGNSVPPLLSKKLAEKLCSTMNNSKQRVAPNE